MLDWAQEAGVMWQYFVLFLFSIIPWVDVSLVVPLGVIWGLHPIAVGMAAFVGNLILILLLGFFFKQFTGWRTERRLKKGKTEPTKRETRSKRIWDKYGVPGLAVLAPILVGTDIAAVLALTFGSSKVRVISWMTVSLAVWTIVFAIGSVYGFSFANLI
ncbi:DNA-binding protein [Virgibacillus phasianinus]|uniref:DNA-binding protein n=1 Tax=Virgibacillus phasianinus TaxID=2017483 RepID=A0A220U8E3_9BACI|nr:small multi-drug export protein [Virgibacillus phasianinus]ASK64003.1 DNA-binding protein [Virgibacillus phasianinus]